MNPKNIDKQNRDNTGEGRMMTADKNTRKGEGGGRGTGPGSRVLKSGAGFMNLVVLLVFSLLFSVGGCRADEEPARTDAGALIYSPDEYGNIIPDFSHVGYMGGGVPLPDVPVVKELSPRPGGDDRERIQSALDEIAGMPLDKDGFRGALLLRAGVYRVHGSLRIMDSGVVLRGEGQFPGGTEVIATKRDDARWRDKHSLIHVGNPERVRPRLGFLDKGFETGIADDTIPVGSRHIHVEDSGGFSVGDTIVIEPHPNIKWFETLGLKEEWGEDFLYLQYERKITGIEGNRLELRSPMVHFIDRGLFEPLSGRENDEGTVTATAPRVSVWKVEACDRISNSGVENIRLVSIYEKGNYEDENHAKTAVEIDRARDCWVRNVTSLHFSFAAVLINSGGRNITVQDCSNLRPIATFAGGRRYGFYVNGQKNLVQRCYGREARHAFGSGSRAPGPNVFLDCLSEKSGFGSDLGPHAKWATGYLYDNMLAPRGLLQVKNQRGNHGWRGVNHVLWNCKAAVIECENPATGDKNWSIGSIALKRRPTGSREKPGAWESHGSRVNPRSLYLYQLEKRLGRRAVEDVTTDVQRQENIEKIERYLKNTLAELNLRERADNNNLFKDPQFKIRHPRSRASHWFRDTEKGRLTVYNLPRKMNPVYGDESAVEIPAEGTLRHHYASALNYPRPSASEYSYILSFDYRAAEGAVIQPVITQHRLLYDESAPYFSRWYAGWETVGSPEAPPAKGKGMEEWNNYSFEFTLRAEPGEAAGIPAYFTVRIMFASDEKYDFANPYLEISDAR